MAQFLMPSLGADMETGKLVQWLVKPGDHVKSGDVVAVVETHKGAIDVEIFLNGVIDHLAPLDEALPVGAVLAEVHGAEATSPPLAFAPVSVPPTLRPRMTPAARHRAQSMGVDLTSVQGSGAGGAITLADVSAAAGSTPIPVSAPRSPFVAPESPLRPAPTVRHTGFDPTQMRQAIAAAMGRSKREIPHYYLTDSIDFSAASLWLEDYNRDRPPEQRLLAAVLLLKATAQALLAVPQLNGFYENNAFRPGPGIHIGWAVALRGGGLVAPAIHHVDRQTLPELMTAMRDLVQRARAGGLRSSELTDPTITVTSLGERGADNVLGVIYPPQVAIVGFGRIEARPWVFDGQVLVRPALNVSLAADHRVTDGHLGGQLLAAIKQALRNPQSL